MSEYTPRPNSGTLWPNDRKANDNHPDVRGDLFIDRQFIEQLLKKDGDLIKVQVSGWAKRSASKEYVSLSISEPYEKPASSGGFFKRPAKETRQAPDEDVPF